MFKQTSLSTGFLLSSMNIQSLCYTLSIACFVLIRSHLWRRPWRRRAQPSEDGRDGEDEIIEAAGGDMGLFWMVTIDYKGINMQFIQPVFQPTIKNQHNQYLVGGCKLFFIFHNIWDVILRIDFHIFQDG